MPKVIRPTVIGGGDEDLQGLGRHGDCCRAVTMRSLDRCWRARWRDDDDAGGDGQRRATWSVKAATMGEVLEWDDGGAGAAVSVQRRLQLEAATATRWRQ
ncbi:hypothetical protein M0R45_015821 [Rubus argutus]|uniref:MHC class I antigen n=1 Tax=Rubus argutus TaxID=59490 RepID=A0AAW1XQV3_RUBAR